MSIFDATQKLIHHFDHNNQWLIDQWSPDLETQINVIPGAQNQEVSGRKNTWTNGDHIWKHIRWPYDANSNPNFKDYLLDFPLPDYAEHIGSTWWCWKTKQSYAVTFDFDGLNKKQAGLTPEQLQQIINACGELDYVTLIKSKSGQGIHAYVFFDPDHRPRTTNHALHAAVGRVVLEKMAEDTGFNFDAPVDAVGVIAWFWTKKPNKNSFVEIKRATRNLRADELKDWTEEATKRMKRGRPKVVVYDLDGNEIEDNNIIGFADDEVKLEKEHRKILAALEESGYDFQYLENKNLYHTHTLALKTAHTKFELKGPYATFTSESNLCNCYIRPLKGGGFSVFRFGKGVLEHPLWNHSEKGTTWCTVNVELPPHTVVAKMGGEWIVEQKTYQFESNAELVNCAAVLGNQRSLDLHDGVTYGLYIQGRGLVIRSYVDKDASPAKCDGWDQARGFFKKVLCRMPELDKTALLPYVDNIVRQTWQTGKEVGWYRRDGNVWIESNEKTTTRALGVDLGSEKDLYMGLAAKYPWQLVSVPFKDTDLPGRKWNIKSAQLARDCSPTPGPHPHWDMVMTHLGRGIDEEIASDPIFHKWGIFTGGDYLRMWVACVVRFPEYPLPYLFFVGGENCGKSTFHELLRTMIKDGVKQATTALKDARGFNAELEGAVVAVIDDADLSESPGAMARIKAWTNATTVPIHPKTRIPYEIDNHWKFVQCANDTLSLPLTDGDTRCTCIPVGILPLANQIHLKGPGGLMERCKKELPFFLYTLGIMEIPSTNERTRIPVVNTDMKADMTEQASPPILDFIQAKYHQIPGSWTRLKTVYESYKKWVLENKGKNMSLSDFKISLGRRFPVHQGPTGRVWTVGNITDEPATVPSEAFALEGDGNGRHARV